MRQRMFGFVTATAVLALATANTVSAKPRKPEARAIENGVEPMGGWIETELQDMVQLCTGDVLKLKSGDFFGGSDKVSAIPQLIYTELGLAAKPAVRVLDGQSVSRRFGAVRTGATPAAATETSSISAWDYTNTDDRVTAPGMNSVVYNNTCASVLNAAVEANAGYSVPVASAQAALKADYEGSNSYALSLVSGTFESPILRSFRGAAPAVGERLYSPLEAALSIWSWYRQNPSKASSTNWLLRDFRGAALYKWGGLKQKTRFTGSVSGNVTVPGFSMKSSVTGTAGNTIAIDAESFKVALSESPGAQNYDPLPPISDVITKAAQFASFVISEGSSDTYLFDTRPKRYFQRAKGISRQFCQPGVWQSDRPTVFLKSVSASTDNLGIPECTFEIEYTPTDATANKTLDHSFQQSFTVSGTTYVLKLTPAPIQLSARLEPFLTFTSGQQIPQVAPGPVGPVQTSTLTWDFHYLLTDSGLIDSPGDIDLTQVQLKCPTGVEVTAQPVFSSAIQPGPVAASKMIRIGANAFYQGELSSLSGASDTVECSLTGIVRFTLPSGTVVSRTFPAQTVRYPSGVKSLQQFLLNTSLR